MDDEVGIWTKVVGELIGNMLKVAGWLAVFYVGLLLVKWVLL